MSKYPDCDDCMDTGEVFTHAEDCASDFCALNGDFYSCVGQIVACHCPAGADDENMTDEELTAELLAHGVTPEMTRAGVSRLKAAVGVPDHCRNMRHGITKVCDCPPI